MGPRRVISLVVTLAVALALASCGRSDTPGSGRPAVGQRGNKATAGRALGFPIFATKNTTRVGGGDPVADAAAVAEAVHPGSSPLTRPPAVLLVDGRSWQAGIAASALAGTPLHAPLLLTDGSNLPAATNGALKALAPRGSTETGGAQVIQIGTAGKPGGYRSTHVQGRTPAALAAAIDRLSSAIHGKPSANVVVVSDAQPTFAMPVAGWAAKSGNSVLFVGAKGVPAETAAALKTHGKPRIYVVGPPLAVADGVLASLRRYGTVTRVQGADPVSNAVAFARFDDGKFGWGVSDPGHGIVIASSGRPLDAAAAAPLSASGAYGPLLLLDSPARLPPALTAYMLDIQPGFDKDPVRGVYNHGWLIGDPGVISEAEQAQIDALLEITPVQAEAGAPPAGQGKPGATKAKPGGAKPGGAKPGGAKPGGAKPGGAKPGGAKPGGAKPGGAKPPTTPTTSGPGKH